MTGRRPGGYHELDTVAVFCDFGDRVTLARAERLSLHISGPFAAHARGDERDLAWRAAEAFFTRTALPPAAAIHVEKNIPAGAGLGGGSADAAAVLRGLDRMFGTALGRDELSAIGLTLGADVPMCLARRALRARGIGEEIELLEGWPPLPVVLVWPGLGVPTGQVFAALAERENPPLPDPPRRPETPAAVAQWLALCRNDLEAPARHLAPSIGEALAGLKSTAGCLLARMSGSGSACFGLFPTTAAAQSAAETIRADRPGWWIRAATAC